MTTVLQANGRPKTFLQVTLFVVFLSATGGYALLSLSSSTPAAAVAVAADPFEERLKHTAPEQRAQALYDLAEQRLADNSPKEAIAYYARAVVMARDRGDHALASNSNRRRAVAMLELAKREPANTAQLQAEAIQVLEQNRIIDEQRGLFEHVCRDEIALAQALMTRKEAGDESRALTLLETVEKRASDNPSLDAQLIFEASRRLAYLDRRLTGDVQGSLAASQRVLEFYKRTDDLMGQADTLYRLAQRAIDLQDWKLAEQYARDSVAFWNKATEAEYYNTPREVKAATSQLLLVWTRALSLAQAHDTALLQGQAVAWRQANQRELRSFEAILTQEQEALKPLLDKNPSLAWTLKYGQATLGRIDGKDSSAIWEQLVKEKTANPLDEDAFLVQHAWSMQLIERGQKQQALQKAQETLQTYQRQQDIWHNIPMLNARLTELHRLTAS